MGKMDFWKDRVRHTRHMLPKRIMAVILSLCMIMPAWPAMPVSAAITPTNKLELQITWETTDPTGDKVNEQNCETSYFDFCRGYLREVEQNFNKSVLTTKGGKLSTDYSKIPIAAINQDFEVGCYSDLGILRTFGGIIHVKVKDRVTGVYEEIYTWKTGAVKGQNTARSDKFEISDVWKPAPVLNASDFIKSSMSKNKTYEIDMSSLTTSSGYEWNTFSMGDVKIQELLIVKKDSTPTNYVETQITGQ